MAATPPGVEHVGSSVVARHVEVPLGAERRGEIAIGEHDALTVVERPADHVAGRRHDTGPAPAEHLHLLGDREREVGREGRARDVLGGAHHEGAGLDGDVAHRGDPAVAVVGGRCHPDLRPALVHAPARERHAVLPADEPTDPADAGKVGDAEVVAGADTMEHALVHRRHQLAVTVQQSLWAEQQKGVVERARAFVLSFVDADGEVDPPVGARLHEPVDQRAATSRLESHIRCQRSSAPSTRSPPRPPRRRSGRATRSTRGTPRTTRHRPTPRRAARSPCRPWPRHRGSRGWPARPPLEPLRTPARARQYPWPQPARPGQRSAGARYCCSPFHDSAMSVVSVCGRRSTPR